VSTRLTHAGLDHIDCDPLHDDHKFSLTYQGQSTCFDLLESSASAPARADRIASLYAALAARPDCAVALGIAEVIPPALPAALMQSAEPSIARGKRPLLPAASRIARWGRQFYCLFAVRRAGDPLAPQNQSLTSQRPEPAQWFSAGIPQP